MIIYVTLTYCYKAYTDITSGMRNSIPVWNVKPNTGKHSAKIAKKLTKCLTSHTRLNV